MPDQIRPERPKYHGYYALSALDQIVFSYQGRRAPLRYALAPGFHISRLWRSVSTFFAKPLPRTILILALVHVAPGYVVNPIHLALHQVVTSTGTSDQTFLVEYLHRG
jgi:hypothetical protein